MQQHLIEHAPEHVAVAGVRRGDLYGLADGAAERAGRAGVLGEDLLADLRLHRGAGRDGRAVGAHHLAAEGLLLIGALDHKHLAVQPQIRAGHGQRCAPLAGAGLGRDALEALLLGVIRLRDGAVELVRAGGVIALELVINLRRGLELFLQAVGAHQRRRPVHFVEIADLLRNGDLTGVIVQLLPDQLVAKHGAQIVKAHRLAGAGVQQRGGLIFHVGADVVPGARHLVFRKIDFVRDFFGCHGAVLLSVAALSGQQKRPLSPRKNPNQKWFFGTKV